LHFLKGDVPGIKNPNRLSLVRLVYGKFSIALIDCEDFRDRWWNRAMSREVTPARISFCASRQAQMK